MTLVSPAPVLPQILELVEELGSRFRERARDFDAGSAFPHENLSEAVDAGLHALCVPAAYGGAGLWQPGGYAAWYRVLERLAYYDSSTAQLLQVHNHAAGIIAWHGSDEQRSRLLPQIVEGALCASLGSEAHLYENGAEVLEAELRRVDGGYLLNARKGFASVASAARFLVVWAAIEGEQPYASRMVFAVVPRDATGVTLVDDWQMLGMRSTVSCGVRFSDVFVPDDDVVGRPGGWIRDDPRTFSCAYAANHLGSAQAAFDFVAGYVASRPDLRESEAVRVRLGRMDAKLFAARSCLYSTVDRLDRGDDADEVEADAVRTMHLAKELVLNVTFEGFELVGARAAHERYPLGRMMRDARTFTLHFRDDLYVERLAALALGQGFSAKGGRGGSTPFAPTEDLGQAYAGA